MGNRDSAGYLGGFMPGLYCEKGICFTFETR